jgi:Lysozyme inhibitor LprI
MKNLPKSIIGVLMLSVLLAACGSIESNVEGSWKVVMDDEETNSYMEIGEERIITRKESNENPISAEYILTESEDDKFIIEFVNPESGKNEFLMEGYFENKDLIKVISTPNGETDNSELIRVDSITKELEEKEKEEAVREEERKERAKAEEEEEAKQVAKVEEEKAKQVAKVEKEEKEAIQAAGNSGLKEKYLSEANGLDDKIMKELKDVHPHAQDMQPGFYGQYNEEWDGLLNDVWNKLKDTMPESEFETLKADQNQWIEKKEQTFSEIPDETASVRAEGRDYLAFETKDRTYYLIENYLD